MAKTNEGSESFGFEGKCSFLGAPETVKDHRSWHFVPAHRPDYLERAFEIAADALVFDLEDGVPDGEKDNARSHLAAFLKARRSIDHDRCYLRVNSDPTAFRQDLALLRRWSFGGVVVPKVNTPGVLKSRMRAIARGTSAGRRIALIESFRAVSCLNSILEAWPLYGVGLGLEDMFSDIDLLPAEAAHLSRHVKLRLVVEAKARGLVAIDSVSLEYRNRASLARRCAESRSLGFDGMFSIHPNQIEAINTAFSPRPDDIVWARKIARLTSLRGGSGYSKRGGEVISPPKIRKARGILGRRGGGR